MPGSMLRNNRAMRADAGRAGRGDALDVELQLGDGEVGLGLVARERAILVDGDDVLGDRKILTFVEL